MTKYTLEYFKEERQITLTWSIEDVQSVRNDLSDEEAMKVLNEVKKNHDATIGVSWDVINSIANNLYPNKMN